MGRCLNCVFYLISVPWRCKFFSNENTTLFVNRQAHDFVERVDATKSKF